MNFKGIMKSVTLKAEKYAPEILVTAGVAGVCTSVYMVYKTTASERYVNAMDDFVCTKENIAHCRKMCDENPTKIVDGKEVERYTKQDELQDKLWNYKKTAIEMAKMYGPSAAVLTVSIGCILGGFGIMKKRAIAAMGAYDLLNVAFNEYRKRVAKEFGKDVDTKMRYDTETVKKTEKVIKEDGTTEKVSTTTQILKGTQVSGFGRLFEQGTSDQWVPNNDYNWLFVKKKRDWLNDKLMVDKHVFLNRVYEELGFPHTKEGALVGWLKDNPAGDGFISFGPWADSPLECGADPEKSILLDFNVDGPIWNKI